MERKVLGMIEQKQKAGSHMTATLVLIPHYAWTVKHQTHPLSEWFLLSS